MTGNGGTSVPDVSLGLSATCALSASAVASETRAPGSSTTRSSGSAADTTACWASLSGDVMVAIVSPDITEQSAHLQPALRMHCTASAGDAATSAFFGDTAATGSAAGSTSFFSASTGTAAAGSTASPSCSLACWTAQSASSSEKPISMSLSRVMPAPGDSDPFCALPSFATSGTVSDSSPPSSQEWKDSSLFASGASSAGVPARAPAASCCPSQLSEAQASMVVQTPARSMQKRRAHALTNVRLDLVRQRVHRLFAVGSLLLGGRAFRARIVRWLLARTRGGGILSVVTLLYA